MMNEGISVYIFNDRSSFPLSCFSFCGCSIQVPVTQSVHSRPLCFGYPTLHMDTYHGCLRGAFTSFCSKNTTLSLLWKLTMGTSLAGATFLRGLRLVCLYVDHWFSEHLFRPKRQDRFVTSATKMVSLCFLPFEAFNKHIEQNR